MITMEGVFREKEKALRRERERFKNGFSSRREREA
jgi:hypothetical protein